MTINFPSSIDDDSTLPYVSDNITEIGGDAINALRSAVFAIETNLGIGANGAQQSVASRLATSLDDSGNIKSSALAGLGLVYLPITDSQVSATAAIQESKLNLTYSTTSLYNLYTNLNSSVNTINGFITLTGVKLEPHIDGTSYNHYLEHIVINPSNVSLFKNKFNLNRNTTNLNTLQQDISSDLSNHERADGTAPNPAYPLSTFTTLSGQSVPANYAHTGSGVYINTSSFSTIPQSNSDLQSFAEFVDASSLLLLGGRVQNLYSNGISRSSHSQDLALDGYSINVVPPTNCTAYLMGVPPGPMSGYPIDSITNGDDIVLFTPSSTQLSTGMFDAQFSQVKPGDYITINYGSGVAGKFLIDSVKSIINGQNRTYAVRLNARNLSSSSIASARIDRSPYNENKYNVLATSRAAVINNNGNNAIGDYESLIISSPKGASVLGIGFNPSLFDSTHYNLYLTIYPTGNPSDLLINLPAVDITGNKGATPGKYTIDSIVNAANLAFRAPGYNYRFNAFNYNGQFGICMSDPYNNSAFSIISGTVDSNGNYTSSSGSQYPNNVIDGYNNIDPLGFGSNAANVASPPYTASYSTPLAASQAPTLIFFPLRKNYFYVNGSERDALQSDPIILDQIIDTYGDGYWPATISSYTVSANTVSTTYSVNLDLSKSSLEIGKTIVIQPAFKVSDSRFNYKDYGRFVISNIAYTGCNTPNPVTNITVYDAVHGYGSSPALTSTGIPVNLYYSDNSVTFDAENVADSSYAGQFKRFFEIYVDGNGHTTTHERARFTASGSGINNINFYDVSPKLRGYLTNYNKQIRLTITSYDSASGSYSGYLARWNPSTSTISNQGLTVTGKKGEIVRFYDETNIDFIDFIFDVDANISSFTNQTLDIQLFPSLQLDKELMMISTCQVNDATLLISYLNDKRQFGNVSEKQLSDSALDYINSHSKYLRQNGIIRGFDYDTTVNNTITFNGGLALVNGKITLINNFNITIPIVQDNNGGTPVAGVIFAICVNDKGEIISIPLTDYDSSVNSINNPGRLLQLYNLSTSTAYYVDSSTFSTIVNTRKDLTLLYKVVISATSTSSYTISLSDIRKFVTDNDANNFMVLTGSGYQGSFKSFQSLTTWAAYNSTYQTTALVRGNFTLTSSPTLPNALILQGDGYQSGFTVNASVAFSNITFNNVYFTVNNSMTIGNNCNFINCTFVINSQTGLNLSGNNININGCTFTYAPSTTTNYTSSDLVNSGYGAIYSLISSSMYNININDCIFNSYLSDRFSFINFEFNSVSSVAESIRIKNNKFYTLTSVDDYRAIISFVCLLTSSIAQFEGVRLIDCVIEKNFCNKNQMIAITAVSTLVSGKLTVNYPLTAVNSKIIDNICGTIGALACFDYERNYVTQSNQLAYDKNYGLIVSGNTCHYIASLESKGQFVDGTTIDFAANSSSIVIDKNNCSWIHVIANSNISGIALKNSITKVTYNSLKAYNSTYLSNYGSIAGSSNYAIYLPIRSTASYAPSAVVSNNSVVEGVYYNGTSVTTYDYSSAIYSLQEISIESNYINGISSGTNDIIYLNPLSNSASSIISKNKLFRNGNTVNSYINLNSCSAIVKDNYFDTTTTNGTSTVLVANQASTCMVLENRNQIQETVIPVGGGNFILSSVINTNTGSNPIDTIGSLNEYSYGTNLVANPNNLSVAPWSNGLIYLFSDSSTNITRSFNNKWNLTNYLPNGVKIIDIKMGLYSSSTVTGLSGQFKIGLARMFPYDPSSGTDIMDIKSVIAATSDLDTSVPTNYVSATTNSTIMTALANSASTTQYLEINLQDYASGNLPSGAGTADVSQYFVVNKANPLVLSFTGSWSVTGGGTQLYMSGIKIKYVW